MCVLGVVLRCQVTVVSFVLGLVACVSSLILLVLCMHSRGDDFLARVRDRCVLCRYYWHCIALHCIPLMS